MVRRGWFLVLAVVAACGGDDGEAPAGPPTTAADRPPPTLPAEVAAGEGALVVGDEAVLLRVTTCQLVPATDDGTGVTTELLVSAEDGTGLTVDVVRSSFTADVATVTDTVTVTDEAGEARESSRAERSGRFIDLREPNPVGPLVDVDVGAGTVGAEGVFGPPGGTADDAANVEGSLLLRCP